MRFVGESIVVLFLDKLIQLLKERAELLIGVKNEVKLLLDDLAMINAFLQDSEAEQYEQGAATKREVIKQMREVAYEVEHVIDKYTYHVIMQKRRNMFGKSTHYLFDLGGIGNTIINIKKRIDGIHNNKGRYDVVFHQAAPAAKDRPVLGGLDRSDSSTIERDDAEGLAVLTDTWVRQLTDGNNLKQRDVLIIGMGGLGKSKLSRRIYNRIVADHGGYFECWSWVYGCREFKCRNWLVDILKCMQLREDAAAHNIVDDIEGMTEDELKDKVRRSLQGKRYLVVLDGMWDTGEWENIGSIFPDDRNGSKIVITSREAVITSSSSSSPDQCCWFLPFLSKDESWKLLRNKVFQENECPENLKDTGLELAANCKGLPLSIIVLGKELLKVRLIGANHSLETWRSYERHVNSHLIRTKTLCFDVLLESYIHLPPELKFCFLYLSLFPEDFVISVRQLTELWSAEGLIKDDVYSRDVVDVAEEYLTKLVNRSLVQEVSKRIHGANVKTCCIHSILRELSRFEGEREKFVELRLDNERAPSTGRARRLSIQGNIFAHISSSLYDSSSASSLFLFSESRAAFDETHWKRIFKSFMYVRVLYLWKVSIISIPYEIENLVFLRNITIWGDKKSLEVESIPDSICDLEHLETINIDGHVQHCLPKGVWKMKKLRHLRVSKGMWLPPPPQSLKSRHIHEINLRILSGVVVDEKTASLMAHSMFKKIKKLHLVYNPKKKNKQVDEAKLRAEKAQQRFEKATKKISKAEEKLNKAEKKVMEAEEKQEQQELELRSQVWKSLENLPELESLKFIDFEKFTTRQHRTPSKTLHKMTFVNSYLDLDHLTRILDNCPTLRILKIKKPYGPNVDQLNSAHGRFPRLETFKLVK